MARVQLTDDAKEDIRGLDGSVRTRVLKDLKKLEVSPSQRGDPLGSRNSGNLTGLRKLYVGPSKAYRAVFAAEGDYLAVVIRSRACRRRVLRDGGSAASADA